MSPRTDIVALVATLALAFAPNPPAARAETAVADSAGPARVREGLALSGGGARGLAHVGVLLALEQRGHDPGVIVGTSMGAIVGALYAAGYDAQAIVRIIVGQDWRDLFTPFAFEVGPGRSLRYPVFSLQTSEDGSFITRSYVPDWQINRKLVHYLFAAGVRARGDFDRLPRRFRSVTADLETGDLVAIGSGDLARAARASMAASGFFAPVHWGDRYLTDGGIADYLPADEARAAGATYVIAVDVLRPPPKLRTVDAIAVARRTLEIMTIKLRRERVPPDLLVVPKISQSLAPYEYPVDPTPVIEAGLKETLARLGPAPETPPPSYPAEPSLGSEPSSLGGLLIESGSAALDPFLRRAFRPTTAARYEASRVLRVVDRLYATGLFYGVWPSVIDSTGTTSPVLRLRTEARGPVSVAGGLGFDNDRGGRGWASIRRLGAVATMPAEIALEGTANGVEQWGSVSLRLTTLALGASAWSAGAFFGESEIRFFEIGGDPGDVEVRRAGGWLGFDARWLDPDLRLSVALRADDLDSDAGAEGTAIGPVVRLEARAPLISVAGVPLLLEAEARSGEAKYTRARVRDSYRRSIGPVTAALLGDFTVVSKDAPLDAAPSLGDEALIPGLRWGERRGRLRAVGGVDLSGASLLNATLRLRLRGGIIHDETRPLRTAPYGDREIRIGGVGLSSLWWTPFGRIEVGAEGSTLGDRRAVVQVGTEF